MIEQELTLVFDHESVDRGAAWELISSCLQDSGLVEAVYEFAGKEIPFERVGKMIKQRGRPYFVIKGKLLEFDLTVVGTFRHDAIRIKGPSNVDWDGWVRRLQGAGSFVHAFLVDCEYDFWQNTEDPLQYRARNRSCEGLPMKSNGLPFPLDQQIVDISRNPGRRVLHEGFIEAIGSPMWLGNRFWNVTGANKNAVISEGVEIKEENDVTIISIREPITERARSAIQEALRRSLFPQCK
jgi:hypothetical protein